ncbi:MAG: nucleotide exchange factor GrpE [Acidobacteria bacterium]|nr:nucleotide exchange factor GrpE [Acidobacteriota bacterium]
MDLPEDAVSLSGEAEMAVSDPEGPLAIEAVAAERDALAREKTELQDMLLRGKADYDNMRRRYEKERLEQSEYGAMDAVKAYLPVLDDFERALAAECADKEYARGMELIYQRTVDVLKKLGLEPMSTEGVTFDPHVHHAIEMVSGTDAEDQAVLGEFQRGYHFKSRLLRPALVKVAVR